MSYDANANQVEVIAPGARRTPEAGLEPRVTRTTHDGRDLPWAQTTGTGPEARTSVTEFDGNANLRREVKPGGVDEATKLPLAADPGGSPSASSEAARQATVREYSPADQLSAVHLAFGTRDAEDAKRFRQDFARDARAGL